MGHGSHHLTHSNRTFFERYVLFQIRNYITSQLFSLSDRIAFLQSCFWRLMILAAFCGAIITASEFFKRHIQHPIVISIERDYTTWNTTFPAFTLCSKRKMNETALQTYLTWDKCICPFVKILTIYELFVFSSKMSYRSIVRNKTEQFLRMLVNLTMNNLDTFFDFDEIKASNYLSVSGICWRL